MSFTFINRNTAIADLDAWGSFSELGAEIIEGGDVQAFGKSTFGAPTDPVSAGYFGTSKGKYRLVYPFSEQATLLQGELRITDEITGRVSHFSAGDSWFVTRGTSTVWEVLSEGFTKHYLSFV
ncbi:cupin domain-containing protein [Paraburkholderia ferrariae]|uniref:cupin domain-containing protein n=1 Tax=Paraburkholderia ferrariae TaxID=386056 RepID=UPI000486520F|nr:cupin domain-containing protein [Paraburkholderia ferrariae]